MEKIKNIIVNKKLDIDFDLYGSYIAKLKTLKKIKNNSHLILVTSMNPPKSGAGKTTISIGICDSLNKLGYNAIAALREPSLGPVFGMKGTGSGGGKAKLLPFDKININFTGDFYAIATANNLIVAMIENEIFQNSELDIDPKTICWFRCIDMNDRSLRALNINIDEKNQYDSKFNITAASDLMSIFCLANDLEDFLDRLDNTFIAKSHSKKDIYIKDLQIREAIKLIMEDAINPNIVQTNEKNIALVHGGPFANIAHGCNSIISTKCALSMADYVISEAGFGSDLGAEKFLNIKCREGNLIPSLICLTISLNAIKDHSNINAPNWIESGFENVIYNYEHLKKYGINILVVINKFNTDNENDLRSLENLLNKNNYLYAYCDAFLNGSKNLDNLANIIINNLKKPEKINFIYEINDSIFTKLEKLAKHVYFASSVKLSEVAKKQIIELDAKYKNYYICVSKNPYSLSCDQKLLYIDKNNKYDLEIDHFEINHAAKFIIPITTKVFRMPGLPKIPKAKNFVI